MHFYIKEKRYNVFLYKYFIRDKYILTCKICNELISREKAKNHLKNHIKKGEVKL